MALFNLSPSARGSWARPVGIVMVAAGLLTSLGWFNHAIAQPGSDFAIELKPGDLGAAGLVVNDELGYGDGRAAQRTMSLIHSQLKASGRFTNIEMYQFDFPQQVILRLGKAVKGSHQAADAKLLAGAATLFLIPIQQSYDYIVEITVECRGHQTGHWKYLESITQTQFIFADSNAAITKVIMASVAAFANDARATESLGVNCK